MPDMLKIFVKKEMEKNIQERYPHVQQPAGMYANVVAVKKIKEEYLCTLKILDKNMNINSDFPEIPDVKTNIELKQGDIAVIILLYGGSSVFILGRHES